MKHLVGYFLILLFILPLSSCIAQHNAGVTGPVYGSYPGALGAGSVVTGGKGGKVLYVTSLDDDAKKAGTLRWAINQSGPRTILFKVSGIIELQSILKINKGDLTIAGQSAPGDGITIRNYPVTVSSDNVIIQFIRFRMGDSTAVQDDALKGMGRRDILIDHCSMSWSTDECSSFYDNENFTLQWCILSESLRNSVHNKGEHGYGGIWGGKKASFHHNLLAHHDSRNPRFCGSRYSNNPEAEKVDFRNNVIYNWGSNSSYAGEGGSYNIVNNYYKPGPATLSRSGKLTYRIIAPNSDTGSNQQEKGVWGRFYVAGNVMHGRDDVTTTNKLGIHPDLRSGETTTVEDLTVSTEFSISPMPTHTAIEAYHQVLQKAGASKVRDRVDQRIVKEVEQGTYTFNGSKGSMNGLIDSQSDVGGWPVHTFSQSELKTDTDGDGIPDDWEKKNNLNSQDASDGATIAAKSGYTWLETYLFSLVQHLY